MGVAPLERIQAGGVGGEDLLFGGLADVVDRVAEDAYGVGLAGDVGVAVVRCR